MVKAVPRPLSSDFAPVDAVPEAVVFDRSFDFLLSLQVTKGNGRIIYIDDPEISELYK
jgi:hypothetical protein